MSIGNLVKVALVGAGSTVFARTLISDWQRPTVSIELACATAHDPHTAAELSLAQIHGLVADFSKPTGSWYDLGIMPPCRST